MFKGHPYDVVAQLPAARWIFRNLPQGYRRKLEARFFTGGAGLAGAIVRADLNSSFYASGEPDKLKQTRTLWGGEAGVAWHADKRRRFETDPAFRDTYLQFRQPLIRALDDLLASDSRFTTLCEIGTGNGIFADYLANRFTHVRPVTGLDLSAAQIEQNRRAYPSSAVEFKAAEVRDWVSNGARPGTVLVACGTLECLTQPELEELLRHVAATLHPVAVGLVEPVNIDLNVVQDSQPRGAMTFSHNYPAILARCGFEVRSMDLMAIDASVPNYNSVALLAVSPSPSRAIDYERASARPAHSGNEGRGDGGAT
jgi:hypothetical protein